MNEKSDIHSDHVVYQVEQHKPELIRRGLPQTAGVYVKGEILGVNVWFTVDTGASRTVLSKRVFNKILGNQRPKLTKHNNSAALEQAAGIPLVDYGSCKINMKIGDLMLNKEVYVGDIKDDILLGIDIGVLDVLSSKGIIKIDGNTIPCVLINSEKLRKIVVADTYQVPGCSEMIMDITSSELSDLSQRQLCNIAIEPTLTFTEKHSLLAAPSLVDMSEHKQGKIRVINPNLDTVCIRSGTVIGHAELSEHSETLFTSADIHDLNSTTNTGCDNKSEHLLHNIDSPDKYVIGCTPQPTTKKASCESDGANEVQLRNLTEASVGKLSDKLSESEQTVNNSLTLTELETQLPAYLQPVYGTASTDRIDSEKVQIVQILLKYQDIFSKDDLDLGCTHLTEHSIDTGNAKPVKLHPRKVPLALVDEEQNAIDLLIAQNTIQESMSPWASPIVLVRKKSGQIRLCVDYRKVNEITTKDAYPLPRTRDCLDAMAGATIFTTLDMTSGYNQIPIKTEDIPKTAFVTKREDSMSSELCLLV